MKIHLVQPTPPDRNEQKPVKDPKESGAPAPIREPQERGRSGDKTRLS